MSGSPTPGRGPIDKSSASLKANVRNKRIGIIKDPEQHWEDVHVLAGKLGLKWNG